MRRAADQAVAGGDGTAPEPPSRDPGEGVTAAESRTTAAVQPPAVPGTSDTSTPSARAAGADGGTQPGDAARKEPQQTAADTAEPPETRRGATGSAGSSAGEPAAKLTVRERPTAESSPRPRAPSAKADDRSGSTGISEPADTAGGTKATGEETGTTGETGQTGPPKPTFDVVRVGPTGDTVVAGRGPPNTRIDVTDKGEVIAQTRTNARGEFVALPPEPLSPGKRRLGLRARTGTSKAPKVSRNIVVVDVPKLETAETNELEAAAPEATGEESAERRPTALRVPREGDGRVRVMQTADGKQEATGVKDQSLRLKTISYTVSGHIDVRGTATAGDRVLLYLGDTVIGRARAGADGRWRIIPSRVIPAGMHTLRLEQRDANGRVVATIETPFANQPLLRGEREADFVVIQPGNTLWTIAERTYGKGVRYHVIYKANSDQIADPDLIYPGQVFVLPKSGKTAATDNG